MRIITLNVNGLRSADSKGFYPWLFRQKADVVCLQETRIRDEQMSPRMRKPGSFHAHYLHAEKPGYSGVAVYSRRPPDRVTSGIGLDWADAEGRVLQADFGDLSVVSLYLPSGSSSDERQARKYVFMEHFYEWLEERRASGREFIVCGDWNIAHRNIDLKNWRSNQKNSGFLPEERAWLDRLLAENVWNDTFRRLYPEAEGDGYTWWSNRGQAWQNNVGWRIDYQAATPGIGSAVRQAAVYKRKRFSDHSPLVVDYDCEI